MKNPIIIVVVVILALVGFGVYSLSQKSSSESDSLIKKDGALIQKDKEMTDKTTSPRYIEYSKATLDETKNKRRILFFYANWCPTCRPADAIFKESSGKIPEDVTLIRVNYNDTDTDQEEKDLAKKYGITYQHTYVQIDSQGQEVTRWNGGQIDELLANIK